jgi:hypothetical protein
MCIVEAVMAIADSRFKVKERTLSMAFPDIVTPEMQEWAKSELSRIHKALPQGASCESYSDKGSLEIEHVQGEKRYALKGKSLR